MEEFVSNDIILADARSLVLSIKEMDEYKSYCVVANKVNSNSDITLLLNKIKALQQEYVKGAYLDSNIKNELDCCKKLLDSNVLYQEYLVKEKKLKALLSGISVGLDVVFDNMVNKVKIDL